MKQSIIKSLAIGLSLLATVSLSAQNNYQLPNNGFESWDGSANDAEPTHWNSFATCDGNGLASSIAGHFDCYVYFAHDRMNFL